MPVRLKPSSSKIALANPAASLDPEQPAERPRLDSTEFNEVNSQQTAKRVVGKLS